MEVGRYMKNYVGTKTFVRSILDLKPADEYAAISIHPGPNLPDTPNRYILLTRYGGNGYDADGVLDDRAWQVRVASKQGDYSSGEEVADWIDTFFTNMPSSRIGGLWVTSIQRVGGAPSALMTDDADRTHFVCSYMASVESALVN